MKKKMNVQVKKRPCPKEIARRLAQSRAVVGKKNEGKIVNRLGIQIHN